MLHQDVFKTVETYEEETARPSSPSSIAAASPYWGPYTRTTSATTTTSTTSSTTDNHREGFSPFVGFCFTINYILGTGFLTIPWAFAQGGLALSAIVIVTVGILSDMAKTYILESMARAEAMLDHRMHWIKKSADKGGEAPTTTTTRLVYSPRIRRNDITTTTDNETKRLLTGAVDYDYESTPQQSRQQQQQQQQLKIPITMSSSSLSGMSSPSAPGTPVIRKQRLLLLKKQRTNSIKYVVSDDRKFEVNTLCRVFVGKFGVRIYISFIGMYIYCTLWAYTCVFASAMAKAFPLFSEIFDTNYLGYALIFALIVIPLSCMELEEQVLMQVLMTLARLVMFVCMLTTSSLVADASTFQPVPMIRLEGVDKMLPIMVFAHMYHHSIPGLAHPVADKKQLSGIFRGTIAFSTLAYVTLGLTVASAFGLGVAQSSNLMWNDFGDDPDADADDATTNTGALWKRVVSLYVVCFPALDVISAFPLNAITLGNNMLGSYYGSKIHEVEHNRWIRTRFRLLAGIPPIALAILQRQLGKITDYAGTTGFVIGFTFPALLYLQSRSLAQQKNFATTTYYESYASSTTLAWFLLLFGVCMVLYVVYWLVYGSEDEE